MAQVVKSPPANAGDLKGAGSISGSGRSPGEGNGNPPQYSCLDNSMDRGAWWARIPEWVAIPFTSLPQTKPSIKRSSVPSLCHSEFHSIKSLSIVRSIY